jgi:CheY-like chemotaxis protein
VSLGSGTSGDVVHGAARHALVCRGARVACQVIGGRGRRVSTRFSARIERAMQWTMLWSEIRHLRRIADEARRRELAGEGGVRPAPAARETRRPGGPSTGPSPHLTDAHMSAVHAPRPSRGIERTTPRDKLRGSECVLVAHPDPAVRAALRGALAPRGYLVLEAGTASEAERLCDNLVGLHLVLADVAIDGRGGVELRERIRARSPYVAVLLVDAVGRSGAMGGPPEPARRDVRLPASADAIASRVRTTLDGPGRAPAPVPGCPAPTAWDVERAGVARSRGEESWRAASSSPVHDPDVARKIGR